MQRKFGIAFGDFSVHIEKACGVIGAAHDGELQAVGCLRQGPCAAHGGHIARMAEAVEISRTGLQARGVHFGSETCFGRGAHRALAHHLREAHIGGHLVAQRHIEVDAWKLGVRPKDNTV